MDIWILLAICWTCVHVEGAPRLRLRACRFGNGRSIVVVCATTELTRILNFLFLFRMSSTPVPLPAVPLPQITAPSTAIMGGAAAASESWPVWKLVVGGVGFAAVSYGIYSYFGLASGEEEKKGGGGDTAQKGSGSSNATTTATAPVDPQQRLFAGSDDAEPSSAPAAMPATTPPSSIEAPLGPPPTSPQLFLAWRRASGIIHARLAQVFAQNGCAAGWDAAITMTTVRKTNKQHVCSKITLHTKRTMQTRQHSVSQH